MKTKDLTIIKEINPVIAQVSSIEIVSSEDMQNATSTLSQLNKYLDAMTVEKERLTKPINEALKEIRSRYKPTEQLLEEAISDLKSKMSSFQTLALAEQRKEEEKIAKRLADGKLKVETAIKKISEIDAPEAKVATEEGSVGFRTVKKFEIMDLILLPIGFHLPNEPKIREAMKSGIELPGVRYYEEQSIINRRN